MKVRIKFSFKQRVFLKVRLFHIFLIRVVAGWNRPIILNWKFSEGTGLDITHENSGCYVVGCSFRGYGG